LHDPVLHALERPLEQLVERPRPLEAHFGEFLGKTRHFNGRSDWTLAHALLTLDQRFGEPAVETCALCGAREQGGDGAR